MTTPRYFRDDYVAARELFVETCDDAGLDLESHKHAMPGPNGESLFTDCTLIGRRDARNLIVLISGTHGVETLCGSACQSGFIAEGNWRSIDDDTAILIIHALNCWGAAHLRRNNEDNVDLSRNFLDFDKPLPENDAYEEIHSALSCPEFRGTKRDKSDKILAHYRDKHGLSQFITAIMGGQYRHADGMSFGGTEKVWSHSLLSSVLSPFRETAKAVFAIEYHSGLGPYGYGMAVTMQTGGDLERVRSIYGRWVEAPNERADTGDADVFQVRGHPTSGIRDAFPQADLSAIVLEFGTYPPTDSLPVLIDDHWLTHHGDVNSEEGRNIKRTLLEMHHPADPDWRRAVWDRSVQVIEQTIRALP